jgi:hypothetical protein
MKWEKVFFAFLEKWTEGSFGDPYLRGYLFHFDAVRGVK